jgi:hypothetical protein
MFAIGLPIDREPPMRSLAVPGRGWAALVAGVVALGAVAACSSGDHGGAGNSAAAPPSRPAYTGRMFDPCTELGDQTLRAAHLDPASRAVDESQRADWLVCHWKPAKSNDYMVSVLSTNHSMADGRQNATVTDIENVTIGPRSGFTAAAIDPDHLRCYAAMPAQQGMFEVLVVWRAAARAKAPHLPPCSTAAQYATALEPYLPN